MTPRSTLVTALYDLRPHAGGIALRTPSDYLRLGAPILSVDRPLVIATGPDLLPAVRAARGGLPTEYLVVPLLELNERLGGLLRKFRNAFGDHRGRVNAGKDTPAYMLLQHCKFYVLARAAQIAARCARPGGTGFHAGVPAKAVALPARAPEAVTWVDLGLAHVGPPLPLTRLLTDIVDGTRTDVATFGVAFKDAPPPSAADRFNGFHGRCAGGLFTLPTKDADAWALAMKEAAHWELDAGMYPFECDTLFGMLGVGRDVHGATLPGFTTYEASAMYQTLVAGYPVEGVEGEGL